MTLVKSAGHNWSSYDSVSVGVTGDGWQYLYVGPGVVKGVSLLLFGWSTSKC